MRLPEVFADLFSAQYLTKAKYVLSFFELFFVYFLNVSLVRQAHAGCQMDSTKVQLCPGTDT